MVLSPRALPLLALATLASACSSKSAPPPTAVACTIAAPTPPDWHLSASGTTFQDGLGRVVFLRGVNAGGRSKLPPYVPFDYANGQFATALGAYMDRAASWGIDAMRVPFTWAALEPTQGADDQAWLALYDQILDAAWARGIFTIVDFHQDLYAEILCGDGFPSWTIPKPPAPMSDCTSWQLRYYNDPDVTGAFDRFWAAGSSVQAAYVSAWDVMVARYKDKPGVIGFEPINEPGWGTASIDAFESTTLTAFYSKMVPHMRAAAPSSLVFVDPPGVDGVTVSTLMGKPVGDGLVFAPHFYPLSTDPGAVQGGLAPWVTIGTSWNVPVFVGELSANDMLSLAPALTTAHFAAFDALGLSGAHWEYSVAALGWNGETFSIARADGTEYPVAQSLIRPFARAVGGTAISQSYDTTSGTFLLSFTPTSGVTEVSLPARAYASGYDLTLSGACVDATTVPGRLLLQPNTGAAEVSLQVTPTP